MSSNHERSETERLAVLEHRADDHDKTFKKIEGWMHEMRNFVAELVKLETENSHNTVRLDRVENLINQEQDARRAHDAQVDRELQNNQNNAGKNSDWIDWGKKLLLMAATAGITYVLANPPS